MLDLTALCGRWSGCCVEPLCVQAVGGGLSGLVAQVSYESALEVCIHVMH